MDGFATNAAYFEVMLHKQDRALSKMDLTLEKQDKMLEKIDVIVERQDEMTAEVKGLGRDLSIFLRGQAGEDRKGYRGHQGQDRPIVVMTRLSTGSRVFGRWSKRLS
ncbi:MAG: hypothetical protein NZ956_03565 [Candidatus Caldarchaeum sp.]|nr:hypothetical protein [Candidatus Caldarchaeum sp.]